ncbi:StfH/YfcO family fimbrial adhesin [Citrobacter arsenatis]|uniref:StfH/YfcO family fimbrial adhesin n=1 Tax=Citrobacter arsenatis TaxID=2546350 RepID=UPI00300E50C8
MRKALILFLMLMVVGCSQVFAKTTVKATFESVTLYYAIGQSGMSNVKLNVAVATPKGISYGVWTLRGYAGSTLPLESWTGTPGTAPTIKIKSFDNSVNNSNCPNLPSDWKSCGSYTLSITLQSDDFGCPWVASLYSVSTDALSKATWQSPNVRSTICPTVPVDTYDVSWDPNVVKHDTVLSIASTGGTVSSTRKTYLMESGSLCDKSKFDERGAYCRFVGSGVTLSVRGCDNANVTTVASPYALDNVALHDINVTVNTKNIGTGTVKATCSFQYVLDQL